MNGLAGPNSLFGATLLSRRVSTITMILPHVPWDRQLILRLSARHSGASFPAHGGGFGGKYSLQALPHLLQTDPQFNVLVAPVRGRE